MIPGTFYAFVTTSYIMSAKIGFQLSWSVAYPVAAVFAAAYVCAVIMEGKKRIS